jgi:hypothetical protein
VSAAMAGRGGGRRGSFAGIGTGASFGGVESSRLLGSTSR